MKTVTRQALLISVLATIALTVQTSHAEPQQPLMLVEELQIQQSQIADNQTKSESKIANLVETVRVARIYASRAGGPRNLRLSPRKK